MNSFIDYTVNGLVIGNIYALLAVGLALIFGVANLINFAHGSVYTIGAYVGWAAITFLHTPLPVTMRSSPSPARLSGLRSSASRFGRCRAGRGSRRSWRRSASASCSISSCSSSARPIRARSRAICRIGGSRSAAARSAPMDLLIAAVGDRQRGAALWLSALHQARLRRARHRAGPRRGAADGRQRQCGQQRRLRHRLGARRRRRTAGRHVLQPHRPGDELPGDAQGRRRPSDRRRRQRAGRDRRRRCCSASPKAMASRCSARPTAISLPSSC